jgi:glycosyltransferase involved in cell wall biosynthesis
METIMMRSGTEPLISVLTPVHNTEKYLTECIGSVLSQTYQNWEYIIVNNRSTDRTLEIAESYAGKDSRIRVHTNDEFVDIITNHNLAFSLMSPESKYCKVVSADDWLFPDCVRQMVQLAEAHPNVGIVSTYQISSERINNLGMPYDETIVSGREICRRSLMGGPYVFGAPTSLLYRSSIVRKTKSFYPSSSPHADTAACYEQLENCDFGFVHQILAFERVHTGQTSEKSRITNSYIAEHLRYLAEYGSRYLSEPELRNRIRAHLATYYKFLGKSLLRGRGKEFWDYHKDQLKAAGYPLNRVALANAVILHVLDKALNPKRTLEGLFARA